MEDLDIKNKSIAITGGTGSFGKQVTTSFCNTDIGEIRIYSRDEKKQEELRNILNDDRVKFYIGDVRDSKSVNEALRGVDFIFHAAALKQVPSCEFYPLEAIKTNVLGAENVLSAAIENNVKRVVVLSTDKAVYPINAMGQSKALMEKVTIAKGRLLSPEDPIFTLTRYGNVMASRGSIIPLIISQIKSGADLTITDPSMTRFLMSLQDSVALVMHAFKNGTQGDLFVQKSPACTVEDLVYALKDIFNADNSVKIIGTRHGEKLYESLVSREEMAKAESLKNYFRIPADNRDLNYSKYYTDGDEKVASLEDYHSHNTTRLDRDGVKKLLLNLDYIQLELNN
jgi:UDP-N-acetylglucosamine 4,6-dehydratase